jgi:hypothetical protein
MEQIETKRGPGRPPKQESTAEPAGRAVRFVQMHDAFTPLQMAPIMSLSVEGTKKVDRLERVPEGVEVTLKGREFLVPLGNISFLEYQT